MSHSDFCNKYQPPVIFDVCVWQRQEDFDDEFEMTGFIVLYNAEYDEYHIDITYKTKDGGPWTFLLIFEVAYDDQDEAYIRLIGSYDNGDEPIDNGNDPIFVPDEDVPGEDYLLRYPDSIRIFFQAYIDEDDGTYFGESAVYISDDYMEAIQAHYITVLSNEGWTVNETGVDEDVAVFMEYFRGFETILISIYFEYDYDDYNTIYVVYSNGEIPVT